MRDDPSILLAAIVSSGVIIGLAQRRSWPSRLHPVLFLGGTHLVYNLWSASIANTPTHAFQIGATLLSFTAFTVAAWVGSYQSTKTSRGEKRITSWDREDFRVDAAAKIFLLFIGASVFAICVLRAGDVPLLSNNPNSARLTFFPNGAYSTLIVVPLSAVAVASGIAAMSRRPTRRWDFLASLLAIAILAGTANRGLVVAPAVTLTLFAAVRFNAPLLKVAIVGLGVLTAFSVSGYQRDLSAFGPTHRATVNAAGFHGVWENAYPLVQYVSGTSQTFDRTLASFPSRIPFQNGSQFFSPLLMNDSADLYLKQVFGLNFEGFGLALGAMNAFYLDFGLLGIIIGFAVGGWAAGYTYARAIRNGGVWVVSYLLLSTAILLANYGHPFAYIATVATPLATLTILRRSQSLPPHVAADAKL